MLSWLRTYHYWSKHNISTKNWSLSFWKKSTSPWWHKEVHLVLNPEKKMVVIPRPSECCHLTHIKQIMKQEKNLFAWMACKCMPIFSIKLYKYLQYILIANPHITTFLQLFTILTELQLIIARTSPENLHKREENRYMSCDQQHILKEMIHLYLEEWQFSERGQKVINRFKNPPDHSRLYTKPK